MHYPPILIHAFKMAKPTAFPKFASNLYFIVLAFCLSHISTSIIPLEYFMAFRNNLSLDSSIQGLNALQHSLEFYELVF